MYRPPSRGGSGQENSSGDLYGFSQGGRGQGSMSEQDLHSVVSMLQDQVKSQARIINELSEAVQASRQEFFQFRQEVMGLIGGGSGLGVGPAQAPAPAPSSGRYVPPGPERNPAGAYDDGQGDDIAMSAAMSVLDDPTPQQGGRGGGKPQFQSTTRAEEMRRRIQNAFEGAAQKLQGMPDTGLLDEQAWWREMLSLDDGLDLGALQPPQDLAQFMRAMEKEGKIKWSRSAGDGLLAFPLPSMMLGMDGGRQAHSQQASRHPGGRQGGGRGGPRRGQGGGHNEQFDRRGVYGFQGQSTQASTGGFNTTSGRGGPNAYSNFANSMGPGQGSGHMTGGQQHMRGLHSGRGGSGPRGSFESGDPRR